jgi:hypothetical protein
LPLTLFVEEIDLPLSNIFDLCEIFNISGYNWNIVESGVKHHQTNKQSTFLIVNTDTNDWTVNIILEYCAATEICVSAVC